MITRFGMSKKFGLMGLATVESQYLDGRASLTCSDVTAADIDTEVMKMLRDSYKQAKKLLKENREIMDKLAAHLIEKETITGKEFMKIFRKEKGLPEPEEEENGNGAAKKETQPAQQNPAAGSAESEKQPVYGQPASGQSAVEGSPVPDQNSDAAQNRQAQASDPGMQEQTPEAQKEQEQPWRPPCQPQPENRGVFSQAPEPRDDHKH